VAAGRFHIWAIESVDDGVPLVFGLEAGEPGTGGLYPAETLNGRVQRRLAEWAEQRRAFGTVVLDAGQP
jgi:hypothetical protein